MTFLLATWKTLTDSENCSKSRIKFLFWLSFALIGQLFPVYIHSRLSEQFSGSQAGYRRLSESRNKFPSLLEGISQLVCDFIKASKNFNLDFLRKKKLKIVQTISAYSKRTV
jgi:hypothetical protein